MITWFPPVTPIMDSRWLEIDLTQEHRIPLCLLAQWQTQCFSEKGRLSRSPLLRDDTILCILVQECMQRVRQPVKVALILPPTEVADKKLQRMHVNIPPLELVFPRWVKQ